MDNETAIGYMILASNALGLDKELIKQLELEMLYQFDIKTFDEALKKFKE